MSTFKISLTRGRTYTLLDGCGVMLQEGVFLGAAYPEYEARDGARKPWMDTSSVGLLVFDLGERDGRFRYAGVQQPQIRIVKDGVELELMSTYYGNTPSTLRLASEPQRPSAWRLIEE